MSPKIILGQKKILVLKKIKDQKKFGFEKILGLKKNWAQKNVGSEKILGPKNGSSIINFGSEKIHLFNDISLTNEEKSVLKFLAVDKLSEVEFEHEQEAVKDEDGNDKRIRT